MAHGLRLWLLASTLLLAACGDNGATPVGDASVTDADASTPAPGELRSTRERISTPSEDLPALARSNVAFGLALHRAATRAGTNTVLSPYSVAVALAMARAGAVGATGAEIDAAMHVTLSAERMHAAFNTTSLALAARPAEATRLDSEPTVPRPALVLNVVNDLWTQRGLAVVPAYLDTLAGYYGAGVSLLDFIGDPEGSRTAINDRVSTLTMARIPTLIPRGQISTSTRVVLTNAVYFNARWRARFNPDATRDAPFTRLDGTAVDAPMMSHPSMQNLPYARGDSWEAVELPYVGDQLAMLVVLPDAGTFECFDRDFTAAGYDAVVRALSTRLVSLRLPRFSVRLPSLLGDPLRALGMRRAFTDAADFTGLTVREPLKISEVIHEGFIEVTEAGTEAAAATAVVFVDGGIAPGFVSLTVNRPFYYFIRDRGTGALLFIGRVVDPTAR